MKYCKGSVSLLNPRYIYEETTMKYRLITLMFLFLLIGCSYPAAATSLDEQIIEKLIRLEEGLKALNGRFDDINGRFDDINGRFDDVNRRIDDLNCNLGGRIDDTNRRIDDLKGLLFVILAGMFALVGFVIWDRRTALAPAIKRTTILEDALKEFAKKDPKMAEVLRHLGIM